MEQNTFQILLLVISIIFTIVIAYLFKYRFKPKIEKIFEKNRYHIINLIFSEMTKIDFWFKMFYETYETRYGNLVEEKVIKFLDMDKITRSQLEVDLNHMETVSQMIYDKKNTFQYYFSLEFYDEITRYVNLPQLYATMIFYGKNDKKLLRRRIKSAHTVIDLLKHEKISIKNDDMISYFILQWNKIK